MTFTATLDPATGLAVEAAPVASPMPCDIRLVTDRVAFDALGEPWDALFEAAGRPDQLFQSFNWLWHWANHYLDDGVDLRLVTGWRSGRLVMVWPLVQTRTAGLRVLRWMGEPASQYGDVLIEPGPHAAAMLRHGLETVRAMALDAVLLRKVRRNASVYALLANEAVATARSKAPRLDFEPGAGFDAVEARWSPKHRGSRRRLTRRLAASGQISVREEAPGDMARDYVTQALTFKRDCIMRDGDCSPALESAAMLAFFRDALSSTERPVGGMITSILRDGRPIGVALSLTCKGEGFGHILAYDPSCERHGVGVLLAEQVFRAAHRRGLRGFDMLAPAEDFKLRWASSVAKVEDWALPLSLRGRLFVGIWVVQVPRLKRLNEASPPWLTAALWRVYRRLKGRSQPGPATL